MPKLVVEPMLDLVFLALALGLFALTWGFVLLVGRRMPRASSTKH